MPFTTEQFIRVFEKYNQTIFPMQFALILVGIVAVGLAVSRKPFANKTISGLLGFLWLWTGIIYHFNTGQFCDLSSQLAVKVHVFNLYNYFRDRYNHHNLSNVKSTNIGKHHVD